MRRWLKDNGLLQGRGAEVEHKIRQLADFALEHASTPLDASPSKEGLSVDPAWSIEERLDRLPALDVYALFHARSVKEMLDELTTLRNRGASVWHSFEAEGLPKEEGSYWFSGKVGRGAEGTVDLHPFTPNSASSIAFITRWYGAWMPSQTKPDPYQPADRPDEGGRE